MCVGTQLSLRDFAAGVIILPGAEALG